MKATQHRNRAVLVCKGKSKNHFLFLHWQTPFFTKKRKEKNPFKTRKYSLSLITISCMANVSAASLVALKTRLNETDIGFQRYHILLNYESQSPWNVCPL